MLDNLTILVTGGAGYIGSHTILELLNEGHSVVTIDNCINASSGDYSGKSLLNHKEKPLENHSGKTILNQNGKPLENHIEETIANHSGKPLENHNGKIFESHNGKTFENHNGKTFDNHSEKPPSIKRVEELTGKNIVYYEISTLDVDKLTDLFKQHKFDLVIHFAALKAVGESVSQPLRYYRNNITGTLTLLEVMAEAGVKNIVYSSSATVYGSPNYLPMDENHSTGQKITNPYGQTKYMCEQILKDLTRADDSWRVVILRYFNPVGAHESGRIGEDPQGVPNNLMPFISQVAVGERPFLRIFGDDYETPDGTGVRDYIHVVDLAKGHVSSLSKMFSEGFCGWTVFNLGTGKGVSVLEMVETFSEISGREIPYKICDRRQGDLSKIVASCELAKKHLKWTAQKSLKEMCEDTWRWQKNNPKGYCDHR